MDRDEESLLPGPVAVEAVMGVRPHYSTYFRWTQRGLRSRNGGRICLGFIKAGTKRLTNVALVRQFFQAATTDAIGEVVDRRPITRELDIARAEAELDTADSSGGARAKGFTAFTPRR